MNRFEKPDNNRAENNEAHTQPNFDVPKSGKRVLEVNNKLQEPESIESKMLQSREYLQNVRNNYLEQYSENSQSRADLLNRKHILDDYVLEQLSSDNADVFTESSEFKNYAEYIFDTAARKRREINGRVCYPEFMTNPVLKNQEYLKKILEQLGKSSGFESIIQHENNFKSALLEVEKRMLRHDRLSQNELDAMGDYLYSSGKYGSRFGSEFACYMFNDARQDRNLSASTEICGALANYFAHEDSRDARLHDRRIFIANYAGTKKGELVGLNVGLSTSKYTILEQSKVAGIDLNSDEGLNRSRQKTFTDLYSMMMVTFHELTHDRQRLEALDGKDNSTAMGFITNQVLRKNENNCFPVVDHDLKRMVDENGKELTDNYYRANHDSDEIEIQADEEAWAQCRKFIHKHECRYVENNRHERLQRRAAEHFAKCLENAEEVSARRSFALKVNEKGEEMSYIQYDIEQLSKSIHDSPELLKEYPQLANYFDTEGNIRLDIFMRQKVANVEYDSLDTHSDNFGIELATYVLSNEGTAKNLARLMSAEAPNLSKDQIKLCTRNLWNVLRQNAAKTRTIKNVNFDNYADTKTRGKFTSVEALRETYLKLYLRQLYNAARVSNSIRRQRPDLNEAIAKEERNYFATYFYELSSGVKLDSAFAAKVKEVYISTRNQTLTDIANLL